MRACLQSLGLKELEDRVLLLQLLLVLKLRLELCGERLVCCKEDSKLALAWLHGATRPMKPLCRKIQDRTDNSQESPSKRIEETVQIMHSTPSLQH